MSCVHFGPVSDGAGPKLPHSSPARTQRKIVRLHLLSLSDKVKNRAAAAGNPMTGWGDLYRLSRDDSIEVRSWVLRNPACPHLLLKFISVDEEEKSLREFAKYRIRMLE